MPVRHARDVPEARSRLLRYLSEHAAEDWAGTLARGGVRWLDGVDRDAGRLILRGAGKYLAPAAMEGAAAAETAANLAGWQRRAVAAADLFFVSGDLTRLAAAAAETLPAFRMHPEVLPRDIGLLCWAAPVASRRSTRSGAALEVVAASWLAVADGVWVTLYDDAAPIAAPLGEEVRRRMGWLAESQATLLPWAHQLGFSAGWARAPAIRAAIRILMTSWLLMGQTITATRRERPARSDARRIARRGHPTDPVTYVALRAIDRPPAEHDGPDGRAVREWRHRWVVSGHWRNQYYPATDRHRPIWIAPHLKGPEDAPLLHAERVYTLRR